MSISVVVPVLNDERYLPGLLDHLAYLAEWQQVIVVDGGSSDGSVAVAQAHVLPNLVLAQTGGRHRQLNAVLSACSGDWMLLVAADVRLSGAVKTAVESNDGNHGCLRQYSSRNFMHGQDCFSLWRARWLGGAYMDQAPFFRTAALRRIGGFRSVGPYDTADAGYRLGAVGFRVAPAAVVSSCRSYQYGWWLATWANQRHRLRYWRYRFI